MIERFNDLKTVKKFNFKKILKIFEQKGIKAEKLIDELADVSSEKMREFNASISLVKNYVRTLEKIIENLLYLKETSSNVIGSEEVILSKKIDDEISKGMNIQNNTNILMKNITEIVKILKEEVIKSFINYIIIFY